MQMWIYQMSSASTCCGGEGKWRGNLLWVGVHSISSFPYRHSFQRLPYTIYLHELLHSFPRPPVFLVCPFC